MPARRRPSPRGAARRTVAAIAAMVLAAAALWSRAPVAVAAGAVGSASPAASAGANASANPAVAGAAAAPPGQSQGALAQLREFAQATQSARGEFSQRTLRAAGQPPEQASGAFAFARPGRFRWEVRKPYEQLMVADGEQLHFFDKDLNQVTVRRLADSLGASPAAILFGSNELERSFVLKEAGAREGLDWLDAQPRSKDAGFERILIGFRAGLPEAMEVRDAFGRTTVFAFRGVERNPRIDPEQFRFVAPKGADVIRQ